MFIPGNIPSFPKPAGPSATLPGGGSISCAPGQELNVESNGSASCTTPQDTFVPSIPCPPIMPRPPIGGLFPK